MNEPNTDQYIDVKKVLRVLWKNWYFFVIAQVLFVLLAFMSGKIIAPTYEVASSIYIKENGGLESQKAMEFLQSFQLFDQKRNFQNEMLVLKSTPMIQETVEQLNLEVEFLIKEPLQTREIYTSSPFVVMYDSSHVQAIDVPFSISFLTDGKFIITANEHDFKVVDYKREKVSESTRELDLEATYFQAETIETEVCKFQVFINDPDELEHIVGHNYQFVFRDKARIVQQIQNNLNIAPENPEVSIVQIGLKTNSYAKGVDFVTTLTDLYLRKNLDRKNHFAFNTIAYINEQLEEISDSLSIAEKQLESFRSGNQVIDISSKAGRIFERLHQIELERSTTDRQLQYYQYLDEFFEDDDNLSDLVVPSSMGISDQTLNELIRDLIILVNQRNELIGKRQQKSPYLRNLEVQIESLKRPIIENINFSIGTLERALADLDEKISEMKRNLEALPKTERQLVGFERKFQLNDAIYTFLLQRRAEAQIAKASNLPEHEIVEPARLVRQVYPNNMINYGLAIFMGLLVPSLVIMIFQFFDDRVKDETALEPYKHLAFLGSIIKYEGEQPDVMVKVPGEAIAETFRSLRTNLFFTLKGEGHKTILLTSCVSGEGKSFIALNLALSLSQLNKKVVLLGFDLRKRDQFKELVKDHEHGLTSLYVSQSSLDQIIQPSEYNNIDIIAPGIVPPNPMELISSPLTQEIFTDLRNRYDYIIVDTSPVGVVSDGFLLMQHADINLFVIRENYSRKPIVKSVIQEMEDKKIPKLGIILNASRMDNKKYRYKYYDQYHLYANKN